MAFSYDPVAGEGHSWSRRGAADGTSCYPLCLKCSGSSGVVTPDRTWACRDEPWGEHCFVYEIELNG